MSEKAKITQKQIQSRASSQSFSRGKALYSEGAISKAIRRGDEIEARCSGSYSEPYRVWAKLGDSVIISTGCNCEYDWGGDCKHIIALLLTYMNEPDQFEERPTRQVALMSRDKEDLVDIILLMLTRYPDLQNIVDQPTFNEVIKGKAALDILAFRQGLRDSFQNDDYDMDYPAASADGKVREISLVATRFSERGDWLNAALIYRTILEEFAELSEEYYYDEYGELAYEINAVVLCIDDCLKQPIVINDDTERRAIFDALLGVYIWDINFGGIDIGIDAPDIILKHIRKEDIPSIRQLIESIRDQKLKQQNEQWAVKAYNELLTDLDILDNTDPEIILERLRSQGMYELLVNKLLSLQRVDDATAVVKQHIQGEYERIKALELFIDFDYVELALQIAEEGLTTIIDLNVLTWLIDMYYERNNQEKLLQWQQVMMAYHPLAANYKNLKQTALTLNQWDAIRPQVIANLQQKQEFDTLTRIYLIDGEWTLAWETLPKAKLTSIYGEPLDLTLAQASYEAMPEQAIPVYIKYARMAIDNRNRDQYAVAAGLLATVQMIYDQMDEIEKWEQLIAHIRREFKNLPALKDELNKAGL